MSGDLKLQQQQGVIDELEFDPSVNAAHIDDEIATRQEKSTLEASHAMQCRSD